MILSSSHQLTQQVQGQPETHSETQSQSNQQEMGHLCHLFQKEPGALVQVPGSDAL